jgi:diadenosine tetraphosphate (Ap4A) HIT family hydrolase
MIQGFWTRTALLKTGLMGFFSIQHDINDNMGHKDPPLVMSNGPGIAGDHNAPFVLNVVPRSQVYNDGSRNMVSPVQSQAYYHQPPLGDPTNSNDDEYYSNNPTVFGRILRGALPASIVEETDDLVAFQDIHPRAPLHDLIIPKRRIPSVFELIPDDLILLQEMRELAMRQLQLRQPVAAAQGDYRLVFHVPPFNSVDHLHLHVIAPASEIHGIFYRMIKYNGDFRWCVKFDTVMERLEAGRVPVPWPRHFTSAWKKEGSI